VLDVFAPRNGPEIARVLAPSGACVVVTPTPDHLKELRHLGLLGVDPLKGERLAVTMEPLHAVDHRRLDFEMTLDADDIRALVGMGPSAHHVDLDALDIPERARVTGSVAIDTFRRGSSSPT
jgi:23S rRNA (guanine745-N1)-methyltransferase